MTESKKDNFIGNLATFTAVAVGSGIILFISPYGDRYRIPASAQETATPVTRSISPVVDLERARREMIMHQSDPIPTRSPEPLIRPQ